MTLGNIITITFAIIGAASIALKYIAPMTKNKIDDRIYHILEEILKVVSWDRENKVILLFKESDNQLRINIKR